MGYYDTNISSFADTYVQPKAKSAYPGFFGIMSGYRFYDVGMGRWLSRDPLGDEAFIVGYSDGKAYSEKERIRSTALLPLYSMVANNTICFIDNIGLVKFKNCDKPGVDKAKLENYLKAVCDYVNTSAKFNCCFDNNSGLGMLKKKCKGVDSFTIECDDQDSPRCKDEPGSNLETYGWTKPFGNVIHLCGKTANGWRGGEPSSCTLMHELVHTTGAYSETWPERAQECFPTCRSYKGK